MVEDPKLRLLWPSARAGFIGRTATRGAGAAPPKPEPRRRPRPRSMRVQICESGAIRVRGRDIDHKEGLAVLLGRLHASE